MANPMPAAEVEITPELVRRLLRAQHPDLAGLPVEALANGWDNTLFRLGDGLVVRLPRRALGANLLVNEQRWLPVLAPRLPLPVPAPVRIGVPAIAEGYPWPWMLLPATTHDKFRTAYAAAATGAISPTTWARARGHERCGLVAPKATTGCPCVPQGH